MAGIPVIGLSLLGVGQATGPMALVGGRVALLF
jgi:hypothetical protein